MNYISLIIDTYDVNEQKLNKITNTCSNNQQINLSACRNNQEIIENIQRFLDHYTDNQTQRLVIIGNQQTLLITYNLLQKENLPFGFIWSNESINNIEYHLNSIYTQNKPQNQNMIKYIEQITSYSGICNHIQFGNKAKQSKIKNSNLPYIQKIIKKLNAYHQKYNLEIFTKGQFITKYQISSGEINNHNNELNLLLSNYKLLIQKYFNKKNNIISEQKLRILSNKPNTISYDAKIINDQPLDLLAENINIKTWNNLKK